MKMPVKLQCQACSSKRGKVISRVDKLQDKKHFPRLEQGITKG